MAKVNAFGKILSFPDDATTEEIEGFLNSNAHLFDPEYKQPEGLSGLAKNVFTGAKQTGRMVGLPLTLRATIFLALRNMPKNHKYLHNGICRWSKESLSANCLRLIVIKALYRKLATR